MSISTAIPDEAVSGLRNRWYILGTVDMLPSDQPVAVRALGEDLVLWRDGSGAPRLFPDFCAHRRARLSKGVVAQGQLRCQYHGWTYDGSGQCVSVPTQGGECALSRSIKLVSYPVVERAGYFWAYIGDVKQFPPPPLAPPEEYDDPEWSTFPEIAEWNANWLLVFENLVDVMHAPFLHAHSWFKTFGSQKDELKIEQMPQGFMVGRASQRGVGFDWTEAHVTGSHIFLRYDIPYDKWAGPGGPLRIVTSATPIDEGHSRIFFTRFRKVSGWRRALWRALYHVRLRNMHRVVLGQDRTILESQRSLAYAHNGERLAQSDLGVTWLRRAVRAEHDRQNTTERADEPLMAQE